MNQAGNKSYMYGSTAEKLKYDVYEENTVLKAKRVQRSNNKEKVKMVFTILLVFSMLFVVMYRYALIIEKNYGVYKLNQKYNDIKNENSNIKVQIDKQVDLSNIKEIAEKKLGMQKPDKDQITYVKVPKYDFTRVAEDYKDGRTEDENIFGVLVNKVGQLSRVMF